MYIWLKCFWLKRYTHICIFGSSVRISLGSHSFYSCECYRQAVKPSTSQSAMLCVHIFIVAEKSSWSQLNGYFHNHFGSFFFSKACQEAGIRGSSHHFGGSPPPNCFCLFVVVHETTKLRGPIQLFSRTGMCTSRSKIGRASFRRPQKCRPPECRPPECRAWSPRSKIGRA